MREAVEAYCRVIESARGTDRLTFVNAVAVTLSTAFATALRLPDLELGSESTDEDWDRLISHEQWFALMKEVQGVLGEWDNYFTTHEAYRLSAAGTPDLRAEMLEEKVTNLSLADALADIWRDLRNGLNAFDRGVSADEVAWGWRFSFRSHWGAHAADALRALHQQVTAQP